VNNDLTRATNSSIDVTEELFGDAVGDKGENAVKVEKGEKGKKGETGERAWRRVA